MFKKLKNRLRKKKSELPKNIEDTSIITIYQKNHPGKNEFTEELHNNIVSAPNCSKNYKVNQHVGELKTKQDIPINQKILVELEILNNFLLLDSEHSEKYNRRGGKITKQNPTKTVRSVKNSSSLNLVKINDRISNCVKELKQLKNLIPGLKYSEPELNSTEELQVLGFVPTEGCCNRLTSTPHIHGIMNEHPVVLKLKPNTAKQICGKYNQLSKDFAPPPVEYNVYVFDNFRKKKSETSQASRKKESVIEISDSEEDEEPTRDTGCGKSGGCGAQTGGCGGKCCGKPKYPGVDVSEILADCDDDYEPFGNIPESPMWNKKSINPAFGIKIKTSEKSQNRVKKPPPTRIRPELVPPKQPPPLQNVEKFVLPKEGTKAIIQETINELVEKRVRYVQPPEPESFNVTMRVPKQKAKGVKKKGQLDPELEKFIGNEKERIHDALVQQMTGHVDIDEEDSTYDGFASKAPYQSVVQKPYSDDGYYPYKSEKSKFGRIYRKPPPPAPEEVEEPQHEEQQDEKKFDPSTTSFFSTERLSTMLLKTKPLENEIKNEVEESDESEESEVDSEEEERRREEEERLKRIEQWQKRQQDLEKNKFYFNEFRRNKKKFANEKDESPPPSPYAMRRPQLDGSVDMVIPPKNIKVWRFEGDESGENARLVPSPRVSRSAKLSRFFKNMGSEKGLDEFGNAIIEEVDEEPPTQEEKNMPIETSFSINGKNEEEDPSKIQENGPEHYGDEESMQYDSELKQTPETDFPETVSSYLNCKKKTWEYNLTEQKGQPESNPEFNSELIKLESTSVVAHFVQPSSNFDSTSTVVAPSSINILSSTENLQQKLAALDDSSEPNLSQSTTPIEIGEITLSQTLLAITRNCSESFIRELLKQPFMINPSYQRELIVNQTTIEEPVFEMQTQVQKAALKYIFNKLKLQKNYDLIGKKDVKPADVMQANPQSKISDAGQKQSHEPENIDEPEKMSGTFSTVIDKAIKGVLKNPNPTTLESDHPNTLEQPSKSSDPEPKNISTGIVDLLTKKSSYFFPKPKEVTQPKVITPPAPPAKIIIPSKYQPKRESFRKGSRRSSIRSNIEYEIRTKKVEAVMAATSTSNLPVGEYFINHEGVYPIKIENEFKPEEDLEEPDEFSKGLDKLKNKIRRFRSRLEENQPYEKEVKESDSFVENEGPYSPSSTSLPGSTPAKDVGSKTARIHVKFHSDVTKPQEIVKVINRSTSYDTRPKEFPFKQPAIQVNSALLQVPHKNLDYTQADEHLCLSYPIPSQEKRKTYYSKIRIPEPDLNMKNIEIAHKNKRIEARLQNLGLKKLRELSKPASCCRFTEINETQDPFLPFVASLKSLPLDGSDLEGFEEKRLRELELEDIQMDDDISIDDERVEKYLRAAVVDFLGEKNSNPERLEKDIEFYKKVKKLFYDFIKVSKENNQDGSVITDQDMPGLFIEFLQTDPVLRAKFLTYIHADKKRKTLRNTTKYSKQETPKPSKPVTKPVKVPQVAAYYMQQDDVYFINRSESIEEFQSCSSNDTSPSIRKVHVKLGTKRPEGDDPLLVSQDRELLQKCMEYFKSEVEIEVFEPPKSDESCVRTDESMLLANNPNLYSLLSTNTIKNNPPAEEESVYYFIDKTRPETNQVNYIDKTNKPTEVKWAVAKLKIYPGGVRVFELLKSTSDPRGGVRSKVSRQSKQK